MRSDNFWFYLQNRLIQTSQAGGQWYIDPSPFSIPWLGPICMSLGEVAVRAGREVLVEVDDSSVLIVGYQQKILGF